MSMEIHYLISVEMIFFVANKINLLFGIIYNCVCEIMVGLFVPIIFFN